jgi:transposase
MSSVRKRTHAHTGLGPSGSSRDWRDERREKAKQLTDAGMSQREAAAALGVAHTTVQRDLAQSVPESGTEWGTSDRDERREAAIVGNEALAAVEVLELVT